LPHAVKTALGWAINGPLRSLGENRIVSNFIQSDLREQVEKFWKLEAICDQASPESDTCYYVNDKRALKIWNDSIHYDNGNYSLDIPFKDDTPNLPNNLPMPQLRLESLRRRLNLDTDLHKMYTANMKELLSKA
jgi:hypothetical protein